MTGLTDLIQLFRGLTGILEGEERRTWKRLMFVSFISPVVNLFGFSAIIWLIQFVARQDVRASGQKVMALSVFLIVISLLEGLFNLYQCRIANRFEYDGAQKLSVKVYETLMKSDLAYHNQISSMQALAMVRTDTARCIRMTISCIDIWVSLFTMAGYGIVLIGVSGMAGLVSCIVLLLVMAGMFFINHERMKQYGENCRACEIRTNAQVTIAYGMFEEMKLSDKFALIQDRYEYASREYAQVQSRFRYRNRTISMAVETMVRTVMLAVFVFLLGMGTELTVLLAPMAAYMTAMGRMMPKAHDIISGMNAVGFAGKSYETVKDCMGRYEQIQEEEKRLTEVRKKEATFREGLFIRHLTFGYEGKPALFQDVSLDIPAGSSVAVMGVSGTGKSTLLGLVLGLLKPQAGNIWYDDYDIVTHTDREGACQAGIGTLVSYIPQIVYLNGETIRHNVAFFEEDSNIDDRKVEECLRSAQVWEDVLQMPDGIHTLIGENGTTISGGQRQRIALARALYHSFELLIMDEATAALDMETERAVIDSIRHVREGKTILIVTHHASLAEVCDIVYKIEDRKIRRVR